MKRKITAYYATRGPDDRGKEGNGKRQKEIPEEVKELLSHIEDSSGWKPSLSRYTSQRSFHTLATFVAAARRTEPVFPPAEETFSALNWTPIDKVKVVIVGQDPYHGPGQAHGLCFSVKRGVMVPPSLRNIYKELKNDPDVDFPRNNAGTLPKHGCLERWSRQGVLLLNSVLTVKRGFPNSHWKRGWESFTDEVIRALLRKCEEDDRGLVFLLFGKPAAEKAKAIIGKSTSKHTVITTSHPSPLAATKTKLPFLGSRCFSRANAALEEVDMEPIDWNVDDETE